MAPMTIGASVQSNPHTKRRKHTVDWSYSDILHRDKDTLVEVDESDADVRADLTGFEPNDTEAGPPAVRSPPRQYGT